MREGWSGSRADQVAGDLWVTNDLGLLKRVAGKRALGAGAAGIKRFVSLLPTLRIRNCLLFVSLTWEVIR